MPPTEHSVHSAHSAHRLSDIIIVGAGLAGLFAALKFAPRPVHVVSLSRRHAASHWAQGGIAAAVGPEDDWAAHQEDTLKAGAGLADADLARVLAQDAPARIEDLHRMGVRFDRGQDGGWLLRREGAHKRARILSVNGDQTGAAMMRALWRAAEATPSIQFLEGLGVHSLLRDAQGRVCGLAAHPAGATEQTIVLTAPFIVLATGGAGHLFLPSTNPHFACGQASGMGARAGAELMDMEFVQFHPTAFANAGDPAPLATEALRGEGARLINAHGEYFMARYHPRAELAARDIVARAIFAEQKSGPVGLELPLTLARHLESAFPTVHATCQKQGLDPRRQPVPITPAAHYHMGGLKVDAQGRTSLEGLWACGEAAASGAHGGNRLASNSLLEAIVLGARLVEAIQSAPAPQRSAPAHAQDATSPGEKSPKTAPLWLRQMMHAHMGVMREARGLTRMLAALADWKARAALSPVENNIYHAALMMTAAAQVRTESRGAHFRTDFPHTEAAAQRVPLTLERAQNLAERAHTQRHRA